MKKRSPGQRSRVHINIPNTFDRELRNLAAEQNITRNAVINQAIARYLEERSQQPKSLQQVEG